MKKVYTKEVIFNECSQLRGRNEFYKKTGLKRAAIRFDVLNECFNIIDNNVKVKSNIVKEEFENKFENAIKQCKTITEFRRKFPEFVWYLNKNLAKHKHRFINQKFSTPQLVCKIILESILNERGRYNCRTALDNKKELDIFFSKYKLACEYNSYFWHSSLTVQHTDNVKADLCVQKGITLITIKEPYKNAYVCFETYVNEIKSQIKNLLSIINSVANKNITESDVDGVVVSHNEILNQCYNHKDIEYIVTKCNSYAEVRHKYNKIWQYLLKNKLLHVLDPVKRRDHRHMSLEEYKAYICRECATYSLFLKHKTYPFAYRRGYTRDIKQMLTGS